MTQDQPLISGVFLLERYPGKGGWTYTILPRNFKINRKGLWVQVKGTIDGHALEKIKLAPLKEGRMFFAVNAGIRKLIGKEAGDHVELILYGDDPALIAEEEVDDASIIESLQMSQDAYNSFLRRSVEEQRLIFDWIQKGSNLDEKVSRINEVIDRLLMGAGFKL